MDKYYLEQLKERDKLEKHNLEQIVRDYQSLLK